MSETHPFAPLAGTWRGEGAGEYPTIEAFAYTEELVIAPVPGRPLAHWRSTTRDAASGDPRHAESGFLRTTNATPAGVEFVVAHGFGIAEVAVGTFDGSLLELGTTGLAATPSAKQVDAVMRRYELDGSQLRYAIAMAAVGQPLTHHLRAELTRT
jgi:hypothetical protein